MGLELGFAFFFKAFVFVGSVIYQRNQQKKMEKQLAAQRAAAKDAAATRNVRISGSNVPIPILYGSVRVDGATIFTDVKSSFNSVSPNAEETMLGSLGSFSGDKNETLITQSVLGNSNISSVIFADIDDIPYNDSKYANWVKFYINKEGGTRNTSTTLNRLASATFDGLTYSTEYFRMNRDDPQFAGRPNVSYYVTGRKIRTFSGNTLLATKSYSFNTIEILLDYMMDSQVGPGLTEADFDLTTFAEAAAIAGEVILTNRTLGGRAGNTPRDITRHEFHGGIYSDIDHISNIETILDTIPGAIFIRSATGKIKISIPDPGVSSPKDTSLQSVGTIDDDILIEDIDYSQQDTTSRLNQCRVDYYNIAKEEFYLSKPRSGCSSFSKHDAQWCMYCASCSRDCKSIIE
jgi:hypothetical protein